MPCHHLLLEYGAILPYLTIQHHDGEQQPSSNLLASAVRASCTSKETPETYILSSDDAINFLQQLLYSFEE